MRRSIRILFTVAALISAVSLRLCAPERTEALGARIRAMGSAGIAVADDDNTLFTNPAAMSQIDRPMAQLTSQVMDRDKFYSDSASFVGKIYQERRDRRITIEDYLESDYEFGTQPERVSNYCYGIGFTREERSAELNSELGREYLLEEQDTLVIGFATRFPIAEKLTHRPELYGGVSLSFKNHNWRNPSLSGSDNRRDVFDLNLAVFYKASERLNFGMKLNSVVSETSSKDPVTVRDNSTSLDLGASYTFGQKRDTLLALDLINVFDAARAPSPQVRVGLEKRFLDNDLAMRIGSYNGVLTLGFGLHLMNDLRFDYAFENFVEFKEHYVTVQMAF